MERAVASTCDLNVRKGTGTTSVAYLTDARLITARGYSALAAGLLKGDLWLDGLGSVDW